MDKTSNSVGEDADYSNSYELESEIASFNKFAAVWYRKAISLELKVRKLLCSVVLPTFLLYIRLNW